MAYVPGMPTNVWNSLSDKQKKEATKAVENKKKSSSSSSSSSNKGTLPSRSLIDAVREISDSQKSTKQTTSIPTSVPQSVRSNAQQQVYQQQAQQSQQPQQSSSHPEYNQGVTSGYSFIKSLPTTTSLVNKVVGADVSKILVNTNIIKKNSNTQNLTFQQFVDNDRTGNVADKLPTEAREKIYKNAINKPAGYRTTIEKNVIKSYRAKQPEDTTFDDMVDAVNLERTPIACKYATSIDWTRMNKEGYTTVLIEDGSGDLGSKDGIYTIGRERLADVPHGCKTIYVDKNNNWYYIANSSDKADFVKTMEDECNAKCGDILSVYDKYAKQAKSDSDKLVLIDSLVKSALEKASKSRKQEDIDAYYELLQMRKDVYDDMSVARSVAGTYIRKYADTYTKYDDAISEQQGWTVTDELQYQELRRYFGFMQNSQKKSSDVLHTSEFAAFMALSKKRQKYGDSPVYMDSDAIGKLEENAANMQKIVDQYNKWDSVILHMENGEGVGTRLKTVGLELLGVAADPFKSKEQYSKLAEDWSLVGDSMLKTFGLGGGDALEAAGFGDKPFIEAFKDYMSKGYIGLTVSEYAKAQEALRLGDISYAEYIKQERYISNQMKSAMFNNTLSNLDVFDLASVQREYVAWKMAQHPERYSNDAKFKKLQEAYKQIYGTDFNGEIDKWRMAYAVLKMDAGATDDYVYLDASDLKNSSGENYGFIKSFLVGSLTDLSTLIGFGEKALSATASFTKVGKKSAQALADAATDVLEYSIKTSSKSITDKEARTFAESYAKDLLTNSRKAMWKSFHGGDDIVDAFVDLQTKRFTRAIGESPDAIISALEASEKAAFYRTSRTLLDATAENIVEKSFLLSKGTVVTSALRSTAEMFDDLQMALFKASCPVAGAVTGLAKIYRGTQQLINNHLAKEFMDDATKYMTYTEKQVLAELTKMQFDDVFDAGLVKTRMLNIRTTLAEAALSTNDKFRMIAEQLMTGHSENVMRMAADTYTNHIISTFAEKITLKDGVYSIKELEKFAMTSGFNNFDEMWTVVRKNLTETMTEFSTDSLAIINHFDMEYKHLRDVQKLDKYVMAETVYTTQRNAIKNFLGDKTNSLMSTRGVVENPMLLQGAALDLADSIYSFAYSMNPDWAEFVDLLGNNSSIHLAAQDAIEALDVIATGNFGANEVRAAQEALQQYVDQIENIYYPNLLNAYKDATYDVFGRTGYLDTIRQNVVTSLPQDDTVVRDIAKQMSDNIKNMGYTVSPDDIYNTVFKDNDSLKTLSIQKADTIYRIMRDKGSNTIAQIHDNNFMELAKAISNPDNQANKTLVLYADALERQAMVSENPELWAQARNVRTAISNASAVKTTRAFSDVISTGDIDSVLYTGIMDSWTGNAMLINSILSSYPHDQAVTKITKLLVDDTQKQLAKHAGAYPDLLHYGANTVDVGQNVKTLDKILTDNGFVTDEKHMDICFSILSTTDSGAPKDIAFYVRGSEDAPFILRQDLPFDITDGNFSAAHYGCSPVNARNAYANLGYHPTVSRDEFQEQLRTYIMQQKDIALDGNKAIRFIGFNSADGLSNGNKYLNDVIRSTGTSINTANAIDYADILRSNMGDYIIDGDTVANIRTAVSSSINSAKTSSIVNGMAPAIAYDSKTTCAEILSDIFDNIPSGFSGYREGLSYIQELTQNVKGQLRIKAYGTMGAALGMYIDSQALEKLLVDAGAAPQRMQQLIMTSVRNVLGDTSADQVALHKIFDREFVGTWFNTDKIKRVYGDIDQHMDYLHTQAQRINTIHNSIARTDLITNTDSLKAAYNVMLKQVYPNTRLCQIARALNVDVLTPTELYAATSWLYEELEKVLPPSELGDLRTLLLTGDSQVFKDGMCSAILPEGRSVICGSLVDYTDTLVDHAAVRYLDMSEAGYKFSYEFDAMNQRNYVLGNIKNYSDSLDAICAMNGISGTQNKLLMAQSAAVYDPIIAYREYLDDIYSRAYDRAWGMLEEDFDDVLRDKYATRQAVAAYNDEVKQFGEYTRSAAVSAVLNLDSDGMRAHLIRHCGGGLVIDPSAKCMANVDLLPVIQKWRDDFGLIVEEFKYSDDVIKDRTLYRVIAPEVDTMPVDELFERYNHVNIDFANPSVERFSAMRSSSFKASDLSLMDGAHMDAFKQTFFGGEHILDLNGRFNSWSDELYMCNMWTDSDLKQVINPYYSDDPIRSLAQSTHQVRNNMSGLHDLGTVMDNPRMKTKNILSQIGYKTDNLNKKELKTIVNDLKDNGYKMCRIMQEGKKFKLVDFTDVISVKNYDAVFANTICIDSGTFRILSEWNKATTMAAKFTAGGPMYKFLAHAYKIYRDTIRSHQITWYLYGNIGTGIRNMVDSSVKGYNEVIQNGENPMEYLRNYLKAISDSNEYANAYRNIEIEHGTVNRETIIKYFGDDEAAMHKFNLLYGYCQTSGGDNLVDIAHSDAVKDTLKYLTEGADYGDDVADIIRKEWDAVYASRKFRGMNAAEKANHLQEIHDLCMKRVRERFTEGSDELFETISNKFWDYKPTVQSWGDKAISINPVLQHNQAVFDNAETRARLALYETFMSSGASEAEAMEHVIATQFHYAGIGHVEDFMPFTQYSIYNALYWFENADAGAVKNAWRAALYNGDGAMTNREISDMCSKYIANQYYLYDKGVDEDYDRFVANNSDTIQHLLMDGVDSYLGLPREFQAGSYDLNGTHYIKLGNSFVEEVDLIVSLAVGTVMFAKGSEMLPDAQGAAQNLRYAYDTIKYTPLYDKLYSPWKAFMDFTAYAYDAYQIDQNQPTEFKRPFNIWNYFNDFAQDPTTHSLALSGIPLVGAVAANVIGRLKAFNLNLGELMTLMCDPHCQDDIGAYMRDYLCDITGMFMPSLVGTKIEPSVTIDKGANNTYRQYLKSTFAIDPTNYIDYMGRLQKDMGFTPEQAEEILGYAQEMRERFKTYGSNLDYINAAYELLGRGYTKEEIYNLFKQLQIRIPGEDKFLGMYNALPGYLKYDPDMRNQIIAYYTAMGMSKKEAWARMLTNPCVIQGGRLIELSPAQVAVYNKKQKDAYFAVLKGYMPKTEEEWDAYWDSMPFRYPKGEWKEAMNYLRSAGYSYAQAMKMCQAGFMLNNKGALVDVQGQARARYYTYNRLSGAEWDAYWNTVPDYTKYEKGAFGRTMKALKKMGYTDAQARALIQQGIYVDKAGHMLNVAGLQRPVLGYANFNLYYQTIPDYCKYEKGAFKRIYAALKGLGFDYDTSLRLIQQGAYLMDISAAPQLALALMSQQGLTQKQKNKIVVKDMGTLLQKYGATIITGADGKPYMIIDCSGLQRPRKTYSYSRRGRRSHAMDRYYKAGNRKSNWKNYGNKYANKQKKTKPKSKPMYGQYYMRKPFITQGNVSTFNGFTSFRGSNKLTKPYTTQGYVSTYSAQNFLNGSSYGMRKAYKIDMRQYKSGALSTKSAYPASYRNIAVAYRRNLYKDLYAKYGASRMRMRSNQPGYSNASIVRLRRNEIANRERYAERRDRKAEDKRVRTTK